METKRSILKKSLLVLGLSFLCILSCFVIAKPKEAEAASSYKEIDFKGEATKPVKVGKYYYKIKSGTGTIYYSSKKNSGYHKTKITESTGLWTNGKNIYYIGYSKSNFYLYRYNLSKKTNKKVKNLSSAQKKNHSTDMEISMFYNGKIYFTVTDLNEYRYRTYYYDRSSKKVKKVKTDCMIATSTGKYCICQKEYPAGQYIPVTYELDKITSSGKLKKVKKLSKYVPSTGVKISNGKIYYTAFTSSKMNKFTVYRINKDGTGKTKLKTISKSGTIYITKLTSKYVKYTVFDKNNNRKDYKKKF